MTFIFFAGIAAILIPIGLGAAGLAQIFRDFHKEMYIIGGLLMIILAFFAVSGKGLAMLPMPKRMTPKLDPSRPGSIFMLGVFSGAATSCCAPVLAGAITLAVISGAFWKALIVTFAYVFGMTFPLFVLGYLYDRFKIEQSRIIRGKLFEIKFGNKTLFIHSTNLLAGLVFLAMGILLLILAFSENAFWAPSFQAKIGEALNQWSENLMNVFFNIPDIIWGVIIIGIFFILFYKMKKSSKNSNGINQ